MMSTAVWLKTTDISQPFYPQLMSLMVLEWKYKFQEVHIWFYLIQNVMVKQSVDDPSVETK